MTTMYHCIQGDEVFSSSHSRDEERLLLDFLQLFQHKNYAEITLEDTLGDQVIYTKITANQYVGCKVGIEDNQLCSPVFIVLDDSRDASGVTQTAGAAGAAEKLTQQLIKQLYNHKEVAVRRAVAKNPNTPAATLAQLATDAARGVRLEVAKNNTPAAALKQLATDADSAVRRGVARNTNTPAATLEQLATEADSYVRLAVAKNPNTPVATLEQLATDEDSDVRRGVAKKLSTVATLEQLAIDEDCRVRWVVVKNSNTPAETLVQLATDEYSYVRLAVASSPNTPAVILKQLATDAHSGVRLEVAANPNTPAAALEQLATDADSGVRWAATRTLFCVHTPAAILEQPKKLKLGTNMI